MNRELGLLNADFKEDVGVEVKMPAGRLNLRIPGERLNLVSKVRATQTSSETRRRATTLGFEGHMVSHCEPVPAS